jgi:NADP-dependent 3-hydroxy acid dehydrogenase YdfG
VVPRDRGQRVRRRPADRPVLWRPFGVGHSRRRNPSRTTWSRCLALQAVYAATKNAVRTLMEGLRRESTDGLLRTTAVSPGFVRTELADSIDNAHVREQIRRNMGEFAIAPEAVARVIAFAIEQPHDVEIGDVTIRPTAQG